MRLENREQLSRRFPEKLELQNYPPTQNGMRKVDSEIMLAPANYVKPESFQNTGAEKVFPNTHPP